MLQLFFIERSNTKDILVIMCKSNKTILIDENKFFHKIIIYYQNWRPWPGILPNAYLFINETKV